MSSASLAYKAINNRARSLALPNIDWKFYYVVGISLCLLMLVFYVYSVNKLAMGTYLIKDYQRQAFALADENRSLEYNFSKSDFLKEARNKATSLGFEKTSNINYIQILDNSLAAADYSIR